MFLHPGSRDCILQRTKMLLLPRNGKAKKLGRKNCMFQKGRRECILQGTKMLLLPRNGKSKKLGRKSSTFQKVRRNCILQGVKALPLPRNGKPKELRRKNIVFQKARVHRPRRPRRRTMPRMAYFQTYSAGFLKHLVDEQGQ